MQSVCGSGRSLKALFRRQITACMLALQALISVAVRFLNQIPDLAPLVTLNIAKHMAFVHQSVDEVSRRCQLSCVRELQGIWNFNCDRSWCFGKEQIVVIPTTCFHVLVTCSPQVLRDNKQIQLHDTKKLFGADISFCEFACYEKERPCNQQSKTGVRCR